jgi:hypothetical protein
MTKRIKIIISTICIGLTIYSLRSSAFVAPAVPFLLMEGAEIATGLAARVVATDLTTSLATSLSTAPVTVGSGAGSWTALAAALGISGYVSYLGVGSTATTEKYQVPLTTAAIPKSLPSGDHTGYILQLSSNQFPGKPSSCGVPDGTSINTLEAKCVAALQAANPSLAASIGYSRINNDGNGNVATNFYYPNSTNPIYLWQVSYLSGCLRGYTYDFGSNTCLLTNRSLVTEPADSMFRFKRLSNGAFVPDLTDPDWNNTAPSGFDTTNGQSITLSMTDAQGNPTRLLITPNGANVQVTQLTQVTVNGQPSVVTKTATIAANGAPIDYEENTEGNTTVNNEYQALIVNIGSETSSPTIDISTLSKDATLQTTNSRLQTLHDDLTQTSAAPNDPTARTATEIGNTGLFANSGLSALKGWTLPSHTSTCPTATLHLFNQDFVMDQQCNLFESMRSTLAAAATVSWSVLALLIILGA